MDLFGANLIMLHVRVLVESGNTLLIFCTDPTCVLLPPRVTQFENPSLLTRIAVHLATRHNLNISSARQLVTSAKLELFGKVRRLEGGDTMCASSLVAHANDRRDATFVRVSEQSYLGYLD